MAITKGLPRKNRGRPFYFQWLFTVYMSIKVKAKGNPVKMIGLPMYYHRVTYHNQN